MPRYKLQAPLKGWDTTTSLADQEEGFACLLDNYFPDNQKLTLRRGTFPVAELASGGPVQSIIPFNTGERMIAGSGGGIYNVATGALIKNGFTNNFWRGAEYKGNLYLANGIDNAQVYDGTTMTDVAFTGAPDLHFTNITIANNQILCVVENSMDFYYLPVGNVAGELKPFYLSQIAQKGGKLLAIVAFGKDTASGFQKNIAFVTSEGEIIVYNSADFGDATKIECLGSYFTSRPIGRNCVVNWGADVVIITHEGYRPLSQIIANGELMKTSDLFSFKISGAVLEAVKDYSNDPRWMGAVVGTEQFAIFNVPNDSGCQQHVMNLETGAWCRFTGIDASSLCLFGGKLYFGLPDGFVCEYSGNSMHNGEYINGHIKNVYTKMGYDNYKILSLFNTRIKSDSPELEISFDISKDYEDVGFEFVPVDNQEGFYWADENTPDNDPETKYWDEGYWSGGVTDVSHTYSVSGYGIAFSLEIKTSTNNTEIQVFDSWMEYELADALG